MLFHFYAEIENPFEKQKQDILKTVLLLKSLAEATPLPALRQPCPAGRGWKNNMRSWWLVLSSPQSIHLWHRCDIVLCVCDTGRGRATQNPSSASISENNSTSQCLVTWNSWQRKTIRTIKQIVGFRGIKTTPTQGHCSKLNRDYQKYKTIQIKVLCEQSGLIYWHPNGTHWILTFHTFNLEGW